MTDATEALARALLAAGIRSEPNHPTTLDAAYALDIALAALGYEVRPIPYQTNQTANYQAAEAAVGSAPEGHAPPRGLRVTNGGDRFTPPSAAADLPKPADLRGIGSPEWAAGVKRDAADPPCDCGVPWLHPADLPAAVAPLDVDALAAALEKVYGGHGLPIAEKIAAAYAAAKEAAK